MTKRIVGYILNGHEPVPVYDIVEWGKWMGQATLDGSRIVMQTTLPNKITISTVFLGLDHNFWHEGPPILFESMIFGGDNDQVMERYATWDEAQAGHDNAVNYYLKKIEHLN